jgi:hypothetical protein
MEVSGDSSVTAVDVADHPVVGNLAASRSELTGLALWLMAERRQVSPRHMTCPASAACVFAFISRLPRYSRGFAP